MVAVMCQIGAHAQQKESFERLTDYPVVGGVAAPFAGIVDGWLVVVGGCNFPDKPAAEGGTKKFYNEGYALNLKEGSRAEWKALPSLPYNVAYGASVETDKGLVCIGGTNEKAPLTQMFRIEGDAKGNFSMRQLPSLPESIDNAAAANLDGYVYVTGGNQQQNGKAVYRLKPDVDTAWSRVADYTGAKRVQPTLLASGGKLFLAGGFQYTKSYNKCVLANDVIEYDAQNNRWSYCSRLPLDSDKAQRSLIGSSGVVVKGTLLFVGGVNHDIFKAAMEGKAGNDYMKHETSWYKFNDDILLYNVKNQTWSVVYDVACMARAGGILLCFDKHLYMVCGEIQPGVRTQQVSKYYIGEIEQ